MKFGVVVFPGSNCDDDIYYMLKYIMRKNVIKLWHKDQDLQSCDWIILPGGFSYGDYLRAGAIANFSPIMASVKQHAKQGGYILGICNGFQVLTEAGLLPGALTYNVTQRFICKDIYVQSENNFLFNSIYKLPIAHNEGRYIISKESFLSIEDQVLLRYCDQDGCITELSNINGSEENIAGVMNSKRNVFGIMPHPERAADSMLGHTDGQLFIQNLINCF